MNYLINGDFATGDLSSWKLIKPPVTVESDGSGNYAAFGADAKLSQHWVMSKKPDKLTFNLDILVADGSDEATGKVQVLFFLQAGTNNYSVNFNIPESAQWKTLSLPLNLRPDTDAGTVQLLVQPGFNNKVSMRNISVLDDTVG